MTAKSAAQFGITDEELHRMAVELAATAAHPEFLEMLQDVQSAPASQRSSVAREVAHVDNVVAKGIPVPNTFRLTTRTFEEPPVGASPSDSPIVTFDGHSGSIAFHGKVISVTTRQAVAETGRTERVKAEIEEGIEEIGRFVVSPPFQAMLAELAELDEKARPDFVAIELLDPERREKRGLHVPRGMKLQRSNFADGRPTLFCVSKVLPLAYPWHKVTITFDNA